MPLEYMGAVIILILTNLTKTANKNTARILPHLIVDSEDIMSATSIIECAISQLTK